MSEPIITPSTLTEEQRKRILEWWVGIVHCQLENGRIPYDGLKEMFTDFFGEDFYNKLKGENNGNTKM